MIYFFYFYIKYNILNFFTTFKYKYVLTSIIKAYTANQKNQLYKMEKNKPCYLIFKDSCSNPKNELKIQLVIIESCDLILTSWFSVFASKEV